MSSAKDTRRVFGIYAEVFCFNAFRRLQAMLPRWVCSECRVNRPEHGFTICNYCQRLIDNIIGAEEERAGYIAVHGINRERRQGGENEH